MAGERLRNGRTIHFGVKSMLISRICSTGVLAGLSWIVTIALLQLVI